MASKMSRLTEKDEVVLQRTIRYLRTRITLDKANHYTKLSQAGKALKEEINTWVGHRKFYWPHLEGWKGSDQQAKIAFRLAKALHDDGTLKLQQPVQPSATPPAVPDNASLPSSTVQASSADISALPSVLGETARGQDTASGVSAVSTTPAASPATSQTVGTSRDPALAKRSRSLRYSNTRPHGVDPSTWNSFLQARDNVIHALRQGNDAREPVARKRNAAAPSGSTKRVQFEKRDIISFFKPASSNDVNGNDKSNNRDGGKGKGKAMSNTASSDTDYGSGFVAMDQEQGPIEHTVAPRRRSARLAQKPTFTGGHCN